MKEIKKYISKEISKINDYKRQLNFTLANEVIDKDLFEEEYNNMNGRIYELLLILNYIIILEGDDNGNE